MFSAISYRKDGLYLIDQRKLPHSEVWFYCRNLEAAAFAIEDMVVRGAPAIGCTAAFALAQFAGEKIFAPGSERKFYSEFEKAVKRLAKTRPTAVNLFHALNGAKAALPEPGGNAGIGDIRRSLEAYAWSLYEKDLSTCQSIGENGLKMTGAGDRLRVLTHCNTGFLATAGYGTALGIIRSLHQEGRLEHVHVDETRPWLQGARLTAFELQKEGIPHSLQVEGAAAHLMKEKKIDWIVVGADRIAANGDTANKIGTYSLAVLARFHGVKFFVAAPWSTFDPDLSDGSKIPVEQRPPEEVTTIRAVCIAPEGTPAFNPSFDVTPSALIDGIVTETEVIRGDFSTRIRNHFEQSH